MRKFFKNMDIVEGAILGLGAAATLAILLRSKSAYATSSHRVSTRLNPVTPESQAFYDQSTPRGSDFPQAVAIEPEKLSDPKSHLAGVFMTFDGPSNPVKIHELNFTPRKMSIPHDEREYHDIQQFTDLAEIPIGFEEYPRPDHMIHPYDYQHLQRIGLIPADFDVRRIQYTTSLNGENEWVVGYSEPATYRVGGGKRATFKSTVPLWAVSVGKNFNSSSNPPKDFEDLKDFYEVALRTLTAEWLMTNTGVGGCIPGVGKVQCDLERAALMGILLRRKSLRERKRNRDATYEEIAFGSKGQTWNPSSTFVAAYNGYPDAEVKSDFRDPKIRRTFESKWKIPQKFEAYKQRHMWHQPLLAGSGATSFSHYKTLSKVPRFIKVNGRRHHTDVNGYANDHNVIVGGSVINNHGKTFA